jgi:hypothetical protein
MKPENSMSYSKQLPLHSTENQLNVVWYGEVLYCDKALFMSTVSCLSFLARYTMHDTLRTI